jgi:UDP-N-acetylmuramate--alanine ligase
MMPSIVGFNPVHIFHFVGIGGIGMSGLAQVMCSLGYQVSGSDIQDNICIEKLRSLGIKVEIGHKAQRVRSVNAVVVSSAIGMDNVEVVEAKRLGIPVMPRAQLLADLMHLKYGIAVAGTHGKTTTTSMLASVFSAAQLDPTYIVGGKINQMNEHAQLGQGTFLLAEADESDASFLYLNPKIAVLTNIDHDHLGTYDHDIKCLEQAFLTFAQKVPFYGLVVLCGDDPLLGRLCAQLTRPVWTFGFATHNTFYATDYHVDERGSRFCLHAPSLGIDNVACRMPVYGRHNVSNALACVAVALHCRVDQATILRGLANFSGVKRRFELTADFYLGSKRLRFIDDYGHHPTEIEVVLQTIHALWPKKQVVLLFQPHRYSRTKALFAEFVRVLSKADRLLLLPIYSAGEAPVSGVSHQALARAVEAAGGAATCVALEAIEAQLLAYIEDDIILLTQGAGNIGRIAAQLRKNSHVIAAAD